MRVLMAEALGMCFGVRDALGGVRGSERPAEVTVRGELVHNGEVMGELRGRGFRMMAEGDGGGVETGVVVVTAHGISDLERRKLEEAGKRIVDTTCPLVRRGASGGGGVGKGGVFCGGGGEAGACGGVRVDGGFEGGEFRGGGDGSGGSGIWMGEDWGGGADDIGGAGGGEDCGAGAVDEGGGGGAVCEYGVRADAGEAGGGGEVVGAGGCAGGGGWRAFE